MVIIIIGLPNGHHAKCDVFAAGVISAPHLLTVKIVNLDWIGITLWIYHLVNLVSLGHNHTVPLNNHCVCVHAALKSYLHDTFARKLKSN